MAGVSVAKYPHMTSAGAQRARPGLAIVLTIDVTRIPEIRLLFAVHAGLDIAEASGRTE